MAIQAAGLPLEQAERVPTSAMTEAALELGYRGAGYGNPGVHPAVSECACGDVIVAISAGDSDVQLAVQAHIKTTPHRLWRQRREAA